MVGKGNLAVFESSNISETGETTPTKIGVHALDVNPYMNEFFCSNFVLMVLLLFSFYRHAFE